MDRLPTRWEISEENLSFFKGRVYKDRPRSVVQLLEATVKKYPEKEGFIDEERRLNYKEFNDIANRIASGLQRYGVKRGDRVAILLGTQLEFPLAFFGAMKIGAVVVPLNTRFKGEELAYEINHSESKILVVDEEYWPFIEPVHDQLTNLEIIFFHGRSVPTGTIPFMLLAESEESLLPIESLSESDSAVIMYTSGTTGKPKGAILHHLGLVTTAMDVVSFMSLGLGDKMVCCVPLFHVTGLNMILLGSILGGIPLVLMRNFKIKKFLEIMMSEKITEYIGVINVIWLMVNHPDFEKYDLSAFKRALFGGSFATEEMVNGIKAKIPQLKISVGYGLTEAHANTVLTPFDEAVRKIRAVGMMHPLEDIRIADDNGNALALGKVGEVLIKSPKIFKGYWKNPEATKAAITSDGWLRTGDIGKLDEEGYLYLLDRKKDMINRGGEKIYSLEVENVLSSNPKVLEVSVVGVPDIVMGEAIKAVIVLKPGKNASEEEIKQYCAERLADYKVPKYVEFLPNLPRNPAGKVVKTELHYVPGSK
jgi:acyl-CoA synthetase (AMP-forming)/AMP-acid ligase II